MKKHPLIKVGENRKLSYYASVIEWSDDKFEIAVIEENKITHDTDIDYSYTDDVIIAKSPSEVYSIIQYKLCPHYEMQW